MIAMKGLELQGLRCPLCGGGRLRHHSAKPFDARSVASMSVLECACCEIAWQWPLHRTPEGSAEYFAGKYEAAESGTYFCEESKTAIARLELAFVESVVGRGSLLDIGSGSGLFPRLAFAAGWSAYGVDPAGPERRETRDGRTLTLRRGTLSDLAEPQLFDAITMWDVVEHLEDPLAVLRTCRDRLRDGGWLFLETGNWQSTGRIKGGSAWWCYQLDHRWYFSPVSARGVLERAGLQNIRLHDKTPRPWVTGGGAYDGPRLSSYGLRWLKRPWAFPHTLTEYRRLSRLAATAPDTANLQIFAMAAQKAGP